MNCAGQRRAAGGLAVVVVGAAILGAASVFAEGASVSAGDVTAARADAAPDAEKLPPEVPRDTAPQSPASSDAAAPSSAAGAARSGNPAPKSAAPPVIIGPTRVTLVSGQTIDGIAVLRQQGRVTVVLESGTSIDFEPSKVLSVEALADLESPAKPTPDARRRLAVGVARGPRGISLAPLGLTGKGVRGGGETVGASAALDSSSAKSGRGRDAAAGKASPAKSPRAAPAGEREGAEEPVEGSGGDAALSTDRDDAELAAMLEHAIRNADLEGSRHRGDGDRIEGAGDGEEGEGSASSDTEGGAAAEGADEGGTGARSNRDASGSGGGPDGASSKAKRERLEPPKPEEFDATLPVIRPGFHYVGPRRASDPREPEVEFPRRAPPTVSFGANWWKPKDGFTNPVKWPSALPPATSFPNGLSGWGEPTTSLGPRGWNPIPTIWPGSIFPETWHPTDGFADSKPAQAPPPTGGGPPSEGK